MADQDTWSLDVPDVPGERRYRNSRYFQEDRLRCSEVLEELRLIKSLLSPVGLGRIFSASQRLAWQRAVTSNSNHLNNNKNI